MTDVLTAPIPEKAPKAKRPLYVELPFLLALAVVLALLIKALLLQAFSIPSGSMEQTLKIGDRVLVNKLIYRIRDIHRGEVIVFNGINEWEPESEVDKQRGTVGTIAHRVGTFFGVASDEKDFIKRVIGLPGDRVMCCSPSGKVVVQPPGGMPVELDEPYLHEASDDQDSSKWFCAAGHDRASCPPGAKGLLVPEGRLWVLGDHRGSSADSRFHYTDANQGTIPVNQVVGRAFVIVWPVGHQQILGVPDTFTAALAVPGSQFLLGGVGALPVALLRRRRKRRV